MTDITVVLSPDDVEEVIQLFRQEDSSVLRSDSRGADGKLIVELVVTLTPAIVTLIVKLYQARLAANKYIQFKYKGLEVRSVSEATLLKLIEQSMANANKR